MAGKSIRGMWTLRVTDKWRMDVGTLKSWRIAAKVTAAPGPAAPRRGAEEIRSSASGGSGAPGRDLGALVLVGEGDAAEGGVAGDPGELPTLPVWLDDPASLSPPVAVPTLLQNGAALLAFAMSQRFNAVLATGDERCLLTCDDLLSLRALMVLERVARGETVERPAAPDVSRLLPGLLAHCASEPAIERAWLALIHSAASTQAAVMLQAPQAEWHQAALARRLDPLLPPGVSLTVIDAQGDFNPPLRRAIAAHPPLHDTAARPGWPTRCAPATSSSSTPTA